jgi:hypothetical protein
MNKDLTLTRLNEQILELTLKIHLEYPELYKNLKETPLIYSTKINEKELLNQYLESLEMQYQTLKNQH